MNHPTVIAKRKRLLTQIIKSLEFGIFELEEQPREFPTAFEFCKQIHSNPQLKNIKKQPPIKTGGIKP